MQTAHEIDDRFYDEETLPIDMGCLVACTKDEVHAMPYSGVGACFLQPCADPVKYSCKRFV